MLALHRQGRTAEALEVYAKARARLAAELGIEPGQRLQQTHQQLLHGEPGERPVTPAPTVPRQLPADVTPFAGRIDDLSRLDGLLPSADPALPATAVTIVTIHGTAGVGKTTLAVHWAHRISAQFPDGQLYVNLRGFDSGGSAMTPADATRGFLEALLVPADRIPASADAQAALYRSLLAGKRVLVVLDNARDADHVRPLLPGSPGCLVVVTSRNRLASLVAVEGAHSLPLDLLPSGDARELLVRRLGYRRVIAEPDAVDEIISGCARLPLALAIVAARAAANPAFPLAALAEELREAQGRLDPFDGGEPVTDLRAVLSWSYHTLSAPAARLFRLLGLHPGPDLGLPAAASLADIPVREAQRLLGELSRAHLLTEQTPGRHTFHDLLRAYASELAHTAEPDGEQHRALHRILDHYLHTAHAAASLLEPRRDPIDLAPARTGVLPEQISDPVQALRWFGAEHWSLFAAVPGACAGGFDTHAWQLTWALGPYINRRGNWDDLVAVQIIALEAVRRLADPGAEAHLHRSLGMSYGQLGRYDKAHAELGQALALAASVGDHSGQANIHHNFTWVYYNQHRPAEALAHAQQALDLYRLAGHRAGEGRMLNAVGWMHANLGDHRSALVYCRQALAVLDELDDRPGRANTWDSLGYAHHRLGEHEQAVNCYRQALDLFRADGDRYHEADCLSHLGDAHQAAADPEAARLAWQQALAIFDALGHPGAEPVRTKLKTILA
jgi:tetratricopeptide (TPR) repeat protein